MDNFLRAAIPEPFTILGQRLLPLSIGHWLWLQRLGCHPVTNLDQLIQAVIICSRPVEQIQSAFEDRWLKLKLRLWAWRLGKFDPEEKIALFEEYFLEAISNKPRILEDNDYSIPNGAPWLQHLKMTLITKAGYTLSEALNLPYSLALWDYYSFWENEGRADILGEERRQMKDLANQMESEIKAALAGGEVGIAAEQNPGARWIVPPC